MVPNQQRLKFAVAFNRDRDSYQVPLALAEAGCLERLVTDLYLPDWLADSVLARYLKISHRHRDGLSSRLVEGSLAAIWRQVVGLKLAKNDQSRVDVFSRLDRGLSRRVLRAGIGAGAGFFLYSGYAKECFEDPAARSLRKELFVFHPHAGLPWEILQLDHENHPEISASHTRHLKEMSASDTERVEAEFSLADSVVCASSFTRKSLARINHGQKRITVVPYGCDVAECVEKPSPSGRKARVLYVGQGVQRKGLHHLLKVWARRKNWGADLTLIASRPDPAMEVLATKAGVALLPGQSRECLDQAFRAADIFVMPSLVEGFGLVYLEALAAGCYVIGTENTGLPDLRAPEHVAAVLRAGDLDALENCIESVIKRFDSGGIDSRAIIEFARTCSWQAFRAGIRNAVGIS